MEIEIADHKYIVGKMKSRQQRNVLRRVFPLVLASKELLAFVGKATGENLPPTEGDETREAVLAEVALMFSAAGPIAAALSSMKDEDCDYVFETCLGVVKRRVPAGMTDIVVAGGDLRFEDITLPQQMQLVFAVMKENFEDFFSGLPGLSAAAGMAGAPSS